MFFLELVKKGFTDEEVSKLMQLFIDNDYEVEYNEVASFYINKKQIKYSEIVAIQFGHYGFAIDIKGRVNMKQEEVEEFLLELNKDFELLKKINLIIGV